MRALSAFVSARRARVEARRPKSIKEAVGIAVFKATYLTATFGVAATVAAHLVPGTLVIR